MPIGDQEPTSLNELLAVEKVRKSVALRNPTDRHQVLDSDLLHGQGRLKIHIFDSLTSMAWSRNWQRASNEYKRQYRDELHSRTVDRVDVRNRDGSEPKDPKEKRKKWDKVFEKLVTDRNCLLRVYKHVSTVSRLMPHLSNPASLAVPFYYCLIGDGRPRW